ncbi:MAG: hypothetical protein QG644_491 [Patescibacteria group bacterium]|nr:hypothetical protein [Patescibacteria group bacterium]
MKEKPKEIKILSIALANLDASVFGLGEDNNIYYWNKNTGKWELHINN